ncbi:S-phase kinase-associated protein 1-like [Ochlerotatus camptorhynchus]|uniref:S-phase kinase-associated protein 1-like n=1 Tax=Ochlerotatus camptorhynchus TaxID=644619 RepID=UPI0031D23BE1
MSFIKFQTSDGVVFNVDSKSAKCFGTIKTMLEDIAVGEDDVIPLPNVTAPILEKVIQWVDHHKDDPLLEYDDEFERKRTDNISGWDMEYLKVDQRILVDLMLAANYLDISGLIAVTCKTVANMIKNKTVEEIRSTFNIKNDFPGGAEQQLRLENEYVEERK